MRDATRGGVATVLNELARASGVAILVDEGSVPVKPAVAGAAELLGIDPMYIANEGRLVVFVAPEGADRCVQSSHQPVTHRDLRGREPVFPPLQRAEGSVRARPSQD